MLLLDLFHPKNSIELKRKKDKGGIGPHNLGDLRKGDGYSGNDAHMKIRIKSIRNHTTSINKDKITIKYFFFVLGSHAAMLTSYTWLCTQRRLLQAQGINHTGCFGSNSDQPHVK